MGIEVTKSLVHWNYYLALEQDLSQVSRFIEFSKQNFDCYSIELAHLLIASASEVDVVIKALCNNLNADKNHNNINDYRNTITQELQNIVNENCYVPRFGLELTPWINWNDEENNPNWWNSYNNVKHQRDRHFNDANLKNVLNAIAALHLVNLYFYKLRFEIENGEELEMRDVTLKLQPEPTLLRCEKHYYYENLIVD